ncbi:MAG: shikimate kinase [Deltaproteobacteria bacterium]|nr:shikimate kinase [Deltaproteobacteria bacterium]
MERNIVLIGYRGTGKTAVGRALADRLQVPFFDADAFLEAKLGTTIQDMVARKGWSFFREREKEVIRELSAVRGCVIATGGGAVMDQDNVDCLAGHGFFVLLKADIETMIRRLQGDAATSEQRPALMGTNIYEETRTMIEKRMPTYERVAQFSVDTTHHGIEEVAEIIITQGLASGRAGG